MSELGQFRSVAIMQPYFFPYIGYYQLVHAVDHFVFYDDVSYINRGWVNRNRILINGEPRYITVWLRGASQNKAIRDIRLLDNRRKILRSIELAYRKAPYFKQAMPPIASVLTEPVENIGALASRSVMAVMEHLGVHRTYSSSGDAFAETRALARADRLIAITKACGAHRSINAPGGKDLYGKEYFRSQGIELSFLHPSVVTYAQFGATFHPGLSMIDVLMFNPAERVVQMLSDHSLT